MSIKNPFTDCRPPVVLSELHDAMSSTHPELQQFSIFKHWIAFYHSTLDVTIGTHANQPHGKWQEFVDKIAAVEPHMKQYENCWPVGVYYDFYSRGRTRREKHKFHRAAEDVVVQDGHEMGHDYSLRSNIVFDDGRPPVCIACQQITTTKLLEICQGEGLVDEFFKIGVAFDHHLDILTKLPPAQRIRFLASISNERIDRVKKHHILKALELPLLFNGKANKDDGLVAGTASVIYDLLNCSYSDFKLLLRNAMGLDEDPKLFENLYELMEERSAIYFTIPSPSVIQYKHTIKWLARAYEQLPKMYESCWPIRVYLSKKASMSTNHPFTESEQGQLYSTLLFDEFANTSGSDTTCSTTSPHLDPASNPLYCHTCRDLREIPEKLQIQLYHLGLSALFPVLARMGLKTLQDLEELRGCPQNERLAIINLSGSHLSDLEFFALGSALDHLLQNSGN